MIEEIIKSLIAQMPFVFLLFVMLRQLYGDWKIDRDLARTERMIMMDRIERLNNHLERLSDAILAQHNQ